MFKQVENQRMSYKDFQFYGFKIKFSSMPMGLATTHKGALKIFDVVEQSVAKDQRLEQGRQLWVHAF